MVTLSHGEIAFRLFIAVIIGGIAGLERTQKNRPAGFRTHILVCMGAAVVSMIQIGSSQEAIRIASEYPELAGAVRVDTGRLGVGVISGIGFLGAGTIIKSSGAVRGLTTAASLWTVGCIGLAAGMGYYYLSALSGVMLVFILHILEFVEIKFILRVRDIRLKITGGSMFSAEKNLEAFIHERGIAVKRLEHEKDGGIEGTLSCVCTLSVPMKYSDSIIVEGISTLDNVLEVELI